MNLPDITAIGSGAALMRGNSKTLVNEVSQSFKEMFNEVNRAQNFADQKIEEFATSPDKDIHGTMIAMQKAEISLRLFMQVRAKITQAYQEIVKMPI